MRGRRQDDIIKRFNEVYSIGASPALEAVERGAIGAVVGASGYTTLAQADRLLTALDLSPASRLLDIGAGRGWPGSYLSRKSGCRAVLIDIPRPGMATARSQAERLGLIERCHFALGSGAFLPFTRASFDAIVHTDTL